MQTLYRMLLVCLMSLPVSGSAQMPHSSQHMNDAHAEQYGIQEVVELMQFVCSEIYPRPTPSECVDRVKHGIMGSADPHTQYYNPAELAQFKEALSGSFVGIGIEVGKPEKSSPVFVMGIFPESPAEKAGMNVGDLVTHITVGGQVVSTSSLSLDTFVKHVRGTAGTPVTITVQSGPSTSRTVTLTRGQVTQPQVMGELIEQDSMVYAHIHSRAFREHHHAEIARTYQSLSQKANGKLGGLILSFERNRGGVLEEGVATARLFTRPTDPVLLVRNNDGVSPYAYPVGFTPEYQGDITKGLPILVVIDGSTASASEIVSRYLQHTRRALVVGTAPSYGKGVIQSMRTFRNNTGIKWTSAEYLVGALTDWVHVQCVGVTPDIALHYPDIPVETVIRECDLTGHVGTKGAMPGSATKPSIQELKPDEYARLLHMKDAWTTYRTPILRKEMEVRMRLK